MVVNINAGSVIEDDVRGFREYFDALFGALVSKNDCQGCYDGLAETHKCFEYLRHKSSAGYDRWKIGKEWADEILLNEYLGALVDSGLRSYIEIWEKMENDATNNILPMDLERLSFKECFLYGRGCLAESVGNGEIEEVVLKALFQTFGHDSTEEMIADHELANNLKLDSEEYCYCFKGTIDFIWSMLPGYYRWQINGN